MYSEESAGGFGAVRWGSSTQFRGTTAIYEDEMAPSAEDRES